MHNISRLVLATRNPHKTAEVRMLIGNRYQVFDATEFQDFPIIEETGTTFLENAQLKAEGISRLIDGWVLSDDSGLEVDALGGAPGVWSSSYGGEEGNHAKNLLHLLHEMEGIKDRKARFRCTMVLARDGKMQENFSGAVEGELTLEPVGALGFGYDPIFIPNGYSNTFAELGNEVKNLLSHRSKALAKALDYLNTKFIKTI